MIDWNKIKIEYITTNKKRTPPILSGLPKGLPVRQENLPDRKAMYLRTVYAIMAIMSTKNYRIVIRQLDV